MTSEYFPRTLRRDRAWRGTGRSRDRNYYQKDVHRQERPLLTLGTVPSPPVCLVSLTKTPKKSTNTALVPVTAVLRSEPLSHLDQGWVSEKGVLRYERDTKPVSKMSGPTLPVTGSVVGSREGRH